MTRRPITTFEKTLDNTIPPELLQKTSVNKSIFQQSISSSMLRVATRLNVIAKKT